MPEPASLAEPTFTADPRAVRAVVEAERLSHGYLHNPAFATEISLIDPLPHQRLAVYDHLLPEPRLRFLLADDAGAGKTIMAGLYLREQLARRVIRRILIVPPAGLLGNWQRELKRLFALDFGIVKGGHARTGNPFVGEKSDLLIVSMDTLSGPRVFARLQEPEVEPYDLVVFDEAHKLSANRDEEGFLKRTDRYKLAEALCGVHTGEARWSLDWTCTHVLLLTATPHMGKDYPYYCLWRLMEPSALATEGAFRGSAADWRAHRFLRRTKEEMCKLDGSPLYPRRECHTPGYPLKEGEGSERKLYDEVTAYINKYYNLARAFLNRGAARFAMTVFQRRLASSTWAILRSLEKREKKLEEILARIQAGELTIEETIRLARLAGERDRDVFECETGDEETGADDQEENEKGEDDALGLVFARNIGDLHTERDELRALVVLARKVYEKREESKFEQLTEWTESPSYREEKVLVFTEHRDTADFLARRIGEKGLGEIARIDGTMGWKQREVQMDSFNTDIGQGGARWMIATDAAAEGINLQERCWLMANYDIPWNPARLEQRMGRIHRYGQKHDPVVILNLVSRDTREGRVLKTLLDKLETIRHALQSDKVFDVIGRVFEGVSIRDLVNSLVESDVRDPEERERKAIERLGGHLTKEQIEAEASKERRLFGDGGDVRRHLPRLREDLERDVLRHLMPGHVAAFLIHAAELLGMRAVGAADRAFRFEEVIPGAMDPLRPLIDGHPKDKQGRFTVHRSCSKEAVFVHPGEVTFELFRSLVRERFCDDALRGGIFVDPTCESPYFIHVATASVMRAADATTPGLEHAETLSCKLVAVRQQDNGNCQPGSLDHLLLLRPDPHGNLPPSWRPAPPPGFALAARWFIESEVLPAAITAEKERRATTREERRAAVTAGFGSLQTELLLQRQRLKDKAEAGDARAKGLLTQVKERLKRLDARKDATLLAIDREGELVRPGEIGFIGHALVLPSFDPADREVYDQEVERVAMETVIAHERALGAEVHDVHSPELAHFAGLMDWPGFDVLSIRKAEGVQERRCIEVKGRSSTGPVELSENEWAQALNLRKDYWVYAVFDCASDSPRLLRTRDPVGMGIGRPTGVRIEAHELVHHADRKP